MFKTVVGTGNIVRAVARWPSSPYLSPQSPGASHIAWTTRDADHDTDADRELDADHAGGIESGPQ